MRIDLQRQKKAIVRSGGYFPESTARLFKKRPLCRFFPNQFFKTFLRFFYCRSQNNYDFLFAFFANFLQKIFRFFLRFIDFLREFFAIFFRNIFFAKIFTRKFFLRIFGPPRSCWDLWFSFRSFVRSFVRSVEISKTAHRIVLIFGTKL